MAATTRLISARARPRSMASITLVRSAGQSRDSRHGRREHVAASRRTARRADHQLQPVDVGLSASRQPPRRADADQNGEAHDTHEGEESYWFFTSETNQQS